MVTKSVSRRVMVSGAIASLIMLGSALVMPEPADAGRKNKRSRRRKVTVRTGNQNTYTFDETNTSVVVGPDGPDGPDDTANS
jgi:hypothetical protein